MRLGIQFKKLKMLLNRFSRQLKMKNGGRERQKNSPTFYSSYHTSQDNPHMECIARRFEGKLLLREEIPLSDIYFQQLLDNHHFLPVPAIQKQGSRYLCMRCQNKQNQLFASLPCARCQDTHVYCRNCIRMGRVIACESLYRWNGPPYEWEKHEIPCTWLGKLTYAQQVGADRIQTAIKKREYLISWAVTGAGKTEMLFPAINFALQEGMRICIASPRADVIRELLPRFRTAFREIHIQGLYGGSHDNDGTAQLILSTTHQLFRYERAFDVVIIDEVDAFPYHRDPSLQLAVSRAGKSDAAIIHQTATPRKDQLTQIAAQKAAVVFVPIRYHGHPLILPKWKIVSQLKKELTNHQLPISISAWLEKRSDRSRQMLIFVSTIALAKNLERQVYESLKKLGDIATHEQVKHVHAEDTDRQDKITAFREKKTYALITTTILERGVTFPSVDVIVLDAGHEIFDDAALVQISGRAGRSAKDPDGEVVFFHDGLTDAMVKANEAIEKMNHRRKKLLQKGRV